jgi:UDP-N-acetylmuramyl-tripeptide synthetase
MIELHTPHEAAQWLKDSITGTICTDSRAVCPGDGFIAWPGAATDGRQYIESALDRGALACLMERSGAEAFDFGGEQLATFQGLKAATGAIADEYFDSPSQELIVVAVTGTNGKTSTAWWLAQALNALPTNLMIPCGVIGTLGIGRPPTVQSSGLTTPDPVLLQKSLKAFVTSGLKACAIEASSIGIVEKRLDGTRIGIAIFTNFTQDHLDFHQSMQAYWEAKRSLFSWPGLDAIVINIDDARGAELAETLRGSPVDIWTVSQQGQGRLLASDVAFTPTGMHFHVSEGEHRHLLTTRLVGGYNVSNILGVLAGMRAMQVPLIDAVAACSNLQPVPGRMDSIGGVNEPLVVIDYAHTPDALSQVLTALRTVAQSRNGRLICLFGCGGDRDSSKRPIMGAIAGKLADEVVVTSDNPRSEKPGVIIAQILLGLTQVSHVYVEPDRAVAIAETIARADVNDVLLLAGKGHEKSQETLGQKVIFDDKFHGEAALKLRGQSLGVVS